MEEFIKKTPKFKKKVLLKVIIRRARITTVNYI